MYRDPPWPLDDIPERYPESYLIPKGRNKYEWSAARPFTDMCLIVETAEMMNKFGDSQRKITKQSYNGKVAKYLEIFPENSTKQFKTNAIITKSRRFLPLPSSTPEYFNIEFPLGTKVDDEIMNIEYVIPPT